MRDKKDPFKKYYPDAAAALVTMGGIVVARSALVWGGSSPNVALAAAVPAGLSVGFAVGYKLRDWL